MRGSIFKESFSSKYWWVSFVVFATFVIDLKDKKVDMRILTTTQQPPQQSRIRDASCLPLLKTS
jgi:hypothetical protein